MRLNIITVGSRGDVQPYLALANGLQKAGYKVRLATHAIFEPFIREYDLEFFPIEGNPREILDSEQGKAWLESHKNPVVFFAGMMSLLRKSFRMMTGDILKACEDGDAILYSPLAMAAYDIAEKFKLPSMMLTLQPMIPTRAFPSPAVPGLSFGRLNKISHRLARQLLWQGFRKPTNQFRKGTLDLPRAPFWGPFEKMSRNSHPVLAAFSPSVLPRPSDWQSNAYVTGYWFLERPPGWQPSADLVRFLESGPPPIYVGFGSMTDRNPAVLKQILLDAIRRSGQRAVLHSGWSGFDGSGIPDHVFAIDSVPHDWLFPQMRAVVHHCGAGTTAATLRSGVPGICVPFFGDQHFWASLVHSIGASPAAIARKHLTADGLAAAIQTSLDDSGIRKRAQELGKTIRQEDGIARATEIISRLVGPPV